MKKYIIILLLSITLLPILVQAEDKSIVLKTISLNEKSENVEEISPATIEDNKLLLDFKMYEVGDYIEYKVKVKNNSNETLEIDQNSLNTDDYVKYSIMGSNSIKSGEEEDILLRITYQNKVDDDKYESAKYISKGKIPLKFQTAKIDILNPETFTNKLPIFLVIIGLIGYSIYSIKKNKYARVLILLLSVSIIPYIVSALTEEFVIEATITFMKNKPMKCIFDGEMVQGAEYTNGQYTYRYMQEEIASWSMYISPSEPHPGIRSRAWHNIDADGWGVTLTDKNSTDDVTTPLCSTINGKPIVSTNSMFAGSNANSIDTSSFDTSNVYNMDYMFSGYRKTELDASNLDTSNVTSINGLFLYSSLENLNVDNWNLSILENHNYVSYSASIKEISAKRLIMPENIDGLFGSTGSLKIDVTDWDLSKTKSMASLFSSNSKLEQIIGLDTWDTSNITDMSNMFGGCRNLLSLDLSSWNTSNITDMIEMFGGCWNLKSLDVSGFDTSKVTNMRNMFDNCSSLTNLDLSSFDTSNVTNMSLMFYKCTNLTSLDASSWDTSGITNISQMFNGCTSLTTAYGRTQADCDKLNSSDYKPANVNFIIKS